MVGGPQGGDSSPWLKLFQGRFAPQISWLLPFALLMILLGLYQRRRAERTDVLRAGFVTWGAWLLTVGLVFSDMATIPHTAYMATLAPAIAALCGAGTVLLWRAHRAGGRAGRLLPVVVAAQAAWTWYLWSGFGSFAPWLRWAGLVAALLATVVLVLGRLGGRARARVAAVGAVIGLATAAVGSVAWASSAFDASYDGSAFDAGAGPQGGMGMGTHLPQAAEGVLKNAQSRGGLAGPGGMDPSDKLTGDEQQLWNYVKAHQDGAEYPLATVGWNAAQPYILATGEKVLPMGGFSGQIPQPTPTAFTALVRAGKLHFLLAGGGGMGMMGGGSAGGSGSGSGSGEQITAWAKAHCSVVPAADYGASSQVADVPQDGGTGAAPFGGPFDGEPGQGSSGQAVPGQGSSGQNGSGQGVPGQGAPGQGSSFGGGSFAGGAASTLYRCDQGA
jgi:4-amino-4-deoxy-L-arabinose transferase-like glycosyltransferase